MNSNLLQCWFGKTPLGVLVLTATSKGVQRSALVDDHLNARRLLTGISRAVNDQSPLVLWSQSICEFLAGKRKEVRVPLDLPPATAFQIRVWHAISAIPRGEVRTYSQIADFIDAPNAARAVGSACGANPVPIIIPCHRVVPRGGQRHGNYRWGGWRKTQLLELEAHLDSDTLKSPSGGLPSWVGNLDPMCN